jgi:DNA-directed RNA polymerase subunit RPC12/RpoP
MVDITLTSASRVEQRTFRCLSCGHTALVEVRAIGEGSETMFNSEGTAERRAEENARDEIEHVLAIARCPACGFRDGYEVYGWWRRQLGPLIFLLLVIVGLGWIPYLFDAIVIERDQATVGWAMTAVGLVPFVPMAWLVRAKWSAAVAGVQFSPAPRA